ncbi:MAG: hypothetical protein FWH00_05380, partial [Oscillospiraceae bacterium]|nr:hypothetical protein [Oscillospiraceae bacterium]
MLLSTIKFKLVAVCLLVFLCILALLSYLLYTDIRNSAELRVTETAGHNLYVAMSNIEGTYIQILQFILWASGSTEINEFVSPPRVFTHTYDYRKVVAFAAAQRQLSAMSLTNIVEKCFISTSRGDHITIG